jgi:DNA-binding response OmpR family regulator
MSVILSENAQCNAVLILFEDIFHLPLFVRIVSADILFRIIYNEQLRWCLGQCTILLTKPSSQNSSITERKFNTMDAKRYNILVIDDEQENTEIILRHLDPAVFRCTGENNSEKAFDIAFRTLPDLIIMDWQMPVVSGIDLLKKLRGNKTVGSIPVIIMSDIMTEHEQIRRASDVGAVDFIKKPVDLAELNTRVTLILAFRKEQKARLELEREIFLRHKEYLQSDIEQKAKELTDLTAHAAGNNGKSHNGHSKEGTGAKVNSLTFDPQEIDKHLTMFKKELFSLHWTSIEQKFLENHSKFKTGLMERNPRLTDNDMKLSLLYRMNLSNKEISQMTHVSYEGIRKARTRLRKKLSLESHIDLTEFLKNFD